MHGEDVGVSLFVLLLQIALRGIGAEAPRIDTHHVNGGLAIDDPFRQLPARTAGRRHAKGMAFVQPEILPVPGRANDRRAIRRIGNGAVVNFLDAQFAEGRNPRDAGFNIGLQAIKLALEQFILALRGRPVHIAAGRTLLINAENKAAILFAQIPG